jgi:hypothetical protein
MLKKILLGTAAIAATFTALPASAEAHGRHRGGYYRPVYHPVYYRPVYHPVYRPVYYRPVYHPRPYYSRGYFPSGLAYRDSYRGDGYYRHRCGSGTTAAIIGGAAGALLGREIGRSGRHGYRGYRRGGSGTTGAIIGGAAGALIGREIGRSC